MPEASSRPRGRTAFDRFAERASDVASGAAFFAASTRWPPRSPT